MSERKTIVPKGFESMYEHFHFAQAVREGNTVWCSGQLGVGPDGKCPEDPKAQFRLAFEAVGRVLAEAGASFADVVEMTTFHVGLRQHLGAFSAVKDDFVKKHGNWPTAEEFKTFVATGDVAAAPPKLALVKPGTP